MREFGDAASLLSLSVFQNVKIVLRCFPHILNAGNDKFNSIQTLNMKTVS